MFENKLWLGLLGSQSSLKRYFESTSRNDECAKISTVGKVGGTVSKGENVTIILRCRREHLSSYRKCVCVCVCV